MIVYHGSHTEISNPDINIGRFNLDFGRGFYVTTLQKQAEKWAVRRAVINEKKPTITVYEFNPSGLDILSFKGYTEKWLDFVVENRARTKSAEHSNYDAIYGNIADDDVAATIDEYMRLLSLHRVNDDVKKATLYQLTFSQPNNQYCIATHKGINQLVFAKSYTVEA